MEYFNTRKRKLPVGWYPDTEEQIISMFDKWNQSTHFTRTETVHRAAVVPHAGWFFSGDIAFGAISLLKKEVETVVVVGGHLPGGISPLLYNYRTLETPLGDFTSDIEFLEILYSERRYSYEQAVDNTVEIQLPLIKYFYPESKIVALRVGSGPEAVEMGNEIYKTAVKLGRSIVVIGSTDLTHYGDDYNFTPVGPVEQALPWIKNSNDKKIIIRMEQMDCEGVLESGNKDRAACSAGAAVCAITFARRSGIQKGELYEYRTSYDLYPGNSAVGYAGVYF